MQRLSLKVLLFSLMWISPLWAVTPEERGYEIAREYDARDFGFGDFTAHMQMILENTQGDKSTRELRAQILEVEDSGESERRLLIFDEPGDVRGTVMLTVSQKQRSDDQWLYFPAVKRVKRITSNNKSGPFMGSEFSYEDFSAPELDKHTYNYLRDEPCEGGQCYVFERHPKDQDSGYSKQILWVDQDEYRLWRVDYFDRKQSLLKVLMIDGYKKYADKYWRAENMKMENKQTGKKTTLRWTDYRFKSGLVLSEFQPSVLQNIR